MYRICFNECAMLYNFMDRNILNYSMIYNIRTYKIINI